MATSSVHPSTSPKGGFFNRFRSITRPSTSSSSKSSPAPPPPPSTSVSQPTRRPPKSDSAPIPVTRRKTLFGPVPAHSRDHAGNGYIPVQREQRAAALRSVGLKPAMTMSEMEKEMDEMYAKVVPDPTSSRSGRKGSGEIDEEAESESQKIREAWLARHNSIDKVSAEGTSEDGHDARPSPSRSKTQKDLSSPVPDPLHVDEGLTVVQGPKPLPPVPTTPPADPARRPSQKAEVRSWSTSPSSYSPPSAWNRPRQVSDAVTDSSELIASGSSESTCSDPDVPQTPLSPGVHADTARVRRASSSKSHSGGEDEVGSDGELFRPTAVKEVIVEISDDTNDAGLEFGRLPASKVEVSTASNEEVKPRPRPQKSQITPPVVERRSGIFGSRHRFGNAKQAQEQLPPPPSFPPAQPRPKRSFASLGSKLGFRPRSLVIDTSSSALSPQSPEEKSAPGNTVGVGLRPRPRHAQTVGARPTAIVSPTNLTMHNRASMAIMAETIEDEEMRRLTEAAFLDF